MKGSRLSRKKWPRTHAEDSKKIVPAISFVALALMACDDSYPPCTPEGNGPGTIYGPTPSPLPGPGGPNEPPDWADEPTRYKKNDNGQVCTCGPYDIECTTDPDGVPGDEPGQVASVSSDCGSNCTSNTAAEQQKLMQDMLNNEAAEAGGVICATPGDCLAKCNLEGKYCVAAYSTHPYKAGLTGNLYDCLDTFPKAKYGGSYTCLYQYPNGDACIFAYASKFGPITIPAPPPLCVYKSG